MRRFQRDLGAICKSLGRRLGTKLAVEESRIEISVADLLYAGGDGRKGIPSIAFNLPNDERITEEVGARQVILQNILDAKFRAVVTPIQNCILARPTEDEEIAFRSFLNHTLFHEVSHSIGPHRIIDDTEATTVNRALRQHHSVLEEAKADTLAACFMLDCGNGFGHRSFLESYVAGFLRSIRFGLTSAHGGANAIQFNYLLREGAISLDRRVGKLSLDHDRTNKAVAQLASKIIHIQEGGNFEAAEKFVNTFCRMTSELTDLVQLVSNLPIDIRVDYKSSKLLANS